MEGKILVINLLTVRKPGTTASATLTSFKTSHPIEEYLPVKFLTTVFNSGNIHLKPRGNIFISNDKNKEIDILEINPNTSSVLPNSSREFESVWNNGFITLTSTTENGKTITKKNINWDKLTSLRLGRYTAKALLIYDDGQRDIPLTATTSFWVIPYKAITAILLGIITFIGLIALIIKVLVKKEISKLKK